MAKAYAQIVGIVLLLLGLLGLVLGDPPPLLGILNIDLAEDVVHLLSGAVLAYVGFGRVDAALTRSVVGVVGVVYLLVGVIGFISPGLFGILTHPYRLGDNIVHLLLGVLGIAAGFMLDRTTTVTVNH